MKRGSTLFLKIVLILVATIALVLMLWMPQLEGRATNLDLLSIYLDPFIIYTYIASIPFFACFYQAFKLLGYIEKNQAFSHSAAKSLGSIKYSALTFTCLVVFAQIWVVMGHDGDDSSGALALGMVVTFCGIVVTTAAAVFQRLLQNAVDIKSENDLTV